MPGSEPDADLPALVQARTGGNPLFVSELLRAVHGGRLGRAARRRRWPARVPTRVSELVAHRVARLPAAVADVARHGVGRRRGGRREDARRGARRFGAESVLDLLEQARAAHLLDAAPPGRWQFRHELVRDAVYAERGRPRSGAAPRRGARGARGGHLDPAAGAGAPRARRPAAVRRRPGGRAGGPGRRVGLRPARLRRGRRRGSSGRWPPRRRTRRRDGGPSCWCSCGEAHRHIGEIEAARRAFLAAAELDRRPGAARPRRAGLRRSRRRPRHRVPDRRPASTGRTLLDRAHRRTQPDGRDSVTTVLLEARLAAELYFSDEPGRARASSRRLGPRTGPSGSTTTARSAPPTAVVHDAFVVGQARPRRAAARSRRSCSSGPGPTGSAAALLTAHRARVFDLLAAGDVAGMDAEILAFRRIAEPLRRAGLPVVAGAVVRHASPPRGPPRRGRGPRAGRLRDRRAARSRRSRSRNLSFLLFFLRREQGRLDEMEQPLRDYAARPADIPAMRVGAGVPPGRARPRSTRPGMLAGIDDGGLDRLHDRNWPASWFQLARAAHLVGDRDLAATLLDDRHRPSERCVMVSLATVCLGATDLGDGVAAPHARRPRRRRRALPRRPRPSTPASAPGAGSRRRRPTTLGCCSTGTRPGTGTRRSRLSQLRRGRRRATSGSDRAPALDELRSRLGRARRHRRTARLDRRRPSGARAGVGARLRRPRGAASPHPRAERPRLPAGPARRGRVGARARAMTSTGTASGRHRPPRGAPSARRAGPPRDPRPPARARRRGGRGRGGPATASAPRWPASSASSWPRPSPATWASAAGPAGSATPSSGPARPCPPASGGPSPRSAGPTPSWAVTSSARSTPAPGAPTGPPSRSPGPPELPATRAVAELSRRTRHVRASSRESAQPGPSEERQRGDRRGTARGVHQPVRRRLRRRAARLDRRRRRQARPVPGARRPRARRCRRRSPPRPTATPAWSRSGSTPSTSPATATTARRPAPTGSAPSRPPSWPTRPAPRSSSAA